MTFTNTLRARTRIGGPPGTGTPSATFDRDLDFTLLYVIEWKDLLN